MSKKKSYQTTRKKARLKRGALIALYGRTCFYCSRAISEHETDGSASKLTIDHVRAVSLGGNNDLANLRLACPGCNQARGNGVNLPPPSKRTPPLRVLTFIPECEDDVGRRELRESRAAKLGVTDPRFLPGAKAMK